MKSSYLDPIRVVDRIKLKPLSDQIAYYEGEVVHNLNLTSTNQATTYTTRSIAESCKNDKQCEIQRRNF